MVRLSKQIEFAYTQMLFGVWVKLIFKQNYLLYFRFAICQNMANTRG